METFSRLIPEVILHHDATQDHAPPFLHLDTTGPAQVFPLPQEEFFLVYLDQFPTIDMAMASTSDGNGTWANERSLTEAGDLVEANNVTDAVYKSAPRMSPIRSGRLCLNYAMESAVLWHMEKVSPQGLPAVDV
ncbi:hypothetical protein M408DRAFT_22357 [Serendipita vermifera MAFF 305830]|uniref:Uncharacterized protein n=1 Tax=Serendipita vermifera MAFF 305830 TaxID=933852 RepID=A0A0C3AZD6_SERVB|nr:hypothetical protein M408DRAFT_22357 [Serendipita vermifera MAFF 305830]